MIYSFFFFKYIKINYTATATFFDGITIQAQIKGLVSADSESFTSLDITGKINICCIIFVGNSTFTIPWCILVLFMLRMFAKRKLTAAKTRAKFIGGIRAVYDESLL